MTTRKSTKPASATKTITVKTHEGRVHTMTGNGKKQIETVNYWAGYWRSLGYEVTES